MSQIPSLAWCLLPSFRNPELMLLLLDTRPTRRDPALKTSQDVANKNPSFLPGVARLKVTHPILQPGLAWGKSQGLTLSPNRAPEVALGEEMPAGVENLR